MPREREAPRPLWRSARRRRLFSSRLIYVNARMNSFQRDLRRCKSCSYREACAVDLKRDPNDPVWETYCPNTGAFIALAEARRNHESVKSLYKISERF